MLHNPFCYHQPVDIFRKIAERKIQEAIDRGELDNLPLAGQRIEDDLSGVPEEHRMAFRLLRNAGVLPEELQLKQAIGQLRQALERPDLSADRRRRLVDELNSKESQYNFMLERHVHRLQ